MKVLFASNNVRDWGNSPSISTDTTAFDSARVPYGIMVPDDATVPMKSAHAPSSTNTVWYHFRWKWMAATGSSEDGYMLTIYDINGNALTRLEGYNGNIAAKVYGDSTVTGAYAGGMGSSSIIEFDIMVRVNASEVTMEVYVGQALVSSATKTNVGGRTGARRLDFTMVDFVNGGNLPVFSEFIVAETDTRNARLTRVSPNSAGNYTQWIGAVGNLSDDDDVTAMTANGTGQRASFTKPTLPSGVGTIGTVVSVARAAADPAAPQTLTQFMRIGTADYDGQPQTLTPGMDVYVQNWEVDPSTGAAWTAAGVDAAEIGLLATT